ncbi:MAG: hypothetical protein OEN23_03335 [Paracoccaceae bacterium]|nr:hypothetical protein [Paracoccaceae bacterium]
MRITIFLLAVFAVAGMASEAEAGCIPCPKGYGYWHTKEACVPKIEGFVGTPPKSTWVAPRRHMYSSGGEDPSPKDGPVVDR